MKMIATQKQKGQIFIIVAISLVVLLGSIGLAVDAGMGYLIKAKLNAAVDSASIAAARAVTNGATQAQQTASAVKAGRDFFNANYPTGYLGGTVNFPDPQVVFNGGQVTIDTSATASVPVTFMRVMNFKLLTVAAAAEAVRKDLDMAFVMDTSGSMIPVAATVQANAKLFLAKFNPILDRVALIHFSEGAVVDDPIRPVLRGFDLTSMSAHIGRFNFGGNTNSGEGMWNARNQLNGILPVNRSSLRVIVFFSDGAPNTFASQFKFNPDTACRNAATTFRLPGSLLSGDSQTGTVTGLYQINQQSSALSSPTSCNLSGRGRGVLASDAVPQYYNAHADPMTNVNVNEFHLADGGPRPVTSAPSYANINRVSRNLVEAIAAKARSEGIYVFSLGLGDQLTIPTGPDGEQGEVVLKCMANTTDATPACVAAGAGQPVGIYCHAVDVNGLKPCFDKLASAILRLTK